MEISVKNVKPLSLEQYAKQTFRNHQKNLPYPEKVKQVVAMQKRLAPIYAARGTIIVPWTLTDE